MNHSSNVSPIFQSGERRLMPPDLERVLENDQGFFARYTNREYRMRLLSQAELGMIQRSGAYLEPKLKGMSYVVLMQQRKIGTRLKIICQMPEGTDMNPPESVCCAVFTAVLTASSIRMEEGLLEQHPGRLGSSNKN